MYVSLENHLYTCDSRISVDIVRLCMESRLFFLLSIRKHRLKSRVIKNTNNTNNECSVKIAWIHTSSHARNVL